MGTGKEATESERPALEQLVAMGYEYETRDNLNKKRRSYSEVLLYDRLKIAIKRLNPDLDAMCIQDAISQISEYNYPYSSPSVDTNEKIRAKLISLSQTGELVPVVVTKNNANGPEIKTVKVFDFENVDNNDYLVTNQFKLQGLKNTIFPDIVIFVNGIPLVIIECKSPFIPRAIEQAYEKNLSKYQKPGWGFEKLFFYNHCIIATCGIRARVGTLQSDINHYAKWTNSYPIINEDLEKICVGPIRRQEILIAGLLSKKTLLDHLQNFTIYETTNQKKVKKIAKHQQYRVVTELLSRLRNEQDIKNKGGVIWHTQGSGKSLSMLWFASQLKSKMKNPSILIATDRIQLDTQIHNTFQNCGFPTPLNAKSANHLKELLLHPRGKTIMTTLQKFSYNEEIITKEKIICLVDEAHRTQFQVTANNMRKAIPNAVFFGFTGTPIDEPNKSVYRVFGPMLDKYGFKESQNDGATLPINYEGRMPNLFVDGTETINEIFERVIGHDPDITPDMKKDLQKKYVTKERIAEAPSRIRQIALDIIDHYTKYIEPNGYKAMLVASSREAAVTYKKELDKLNAPISKIIMSSDLGETGRDGTNWDEYYLTDINRKKESEEFKRVGNPTKILIVVDMLLVGYDVPICKVLYLDKIITKHNLLQAIARVNRVYDEAKTNGLVIDYSGVTKDLQRAFEKFEKQDTDGALYPIGGVLVELHKRHQIVMTHLDGLDRNDYDGAIEKFTSADKREQFEHDFKLFSVGLDAVLPGLYATPYISDFKFATEVRQLIRTRYDGVKPSLKSYSQKIKQLIDDHIRSLPPSVLVKIQEISHEKFITFVSKNIKNDKAKAAVIRTRAIAVINELNRYNPAFYENLYTKLQRLIAEEEERRKKNLDVVEYISKYEEIYTIALSEENERKKVFEDYNATHFEFAIYGEISKEKTRKESINITKEIYSKIKSETTILEWKTNIDVKKKIQSMLYEILKNVGLNDNDIDTLSDTIFTLAVNNL